MGTIICPSCKEKTKTNPTKPFTCDNCKTKLQIKHNTTLSKMITDIEFSTRMYLIALLIINTIIYMVVAIGSGSETEHNLTLNHWKVLVIWLAILSIMNIIKYFVKDIKILEINNQSEQLK